MSLSSGSPYPGLRPFKYQESAIFFGRELHKRDLRDKLGRNRFVAVIGSSGSGKSSLVRAGLLPMIDNEGASDAPKRWQWIIFRPGPDPIQSLVRQLRRLAHQLAPELVEHSGDVLLDRWAAMLRGSSAGLVEIVAGIRRAAPSDALPRRMAMLVVVDQFEELFRFEDSSPSLSARRHGEETRALIRALLAASDAPPGENDVYVLTTMRSDFLGDCVKFAGLAEAVSNSQFLVPKLTRDQRREAIVQPTERRKSHIEPELVQELLNATDDEAEDLPVMQHALMRCWRQAATGATSKKKVKLTLEDYNRIGGIEKALSNHADEIYGELTAGEQTHRANAIEYLFRALTAIDSNGRIIRRPQRFREIVEVTGRSADFVRPIVDRFRQEDCSFLFPPPKVNTNEPNLEFSNEIQPGEELCDDTMVDLSHEALIRRWTMISDRTRDDLSGGQRGWVYREQRDAELWRALGVQAEAWQSDPRAVLSEETTRRRKEWLELLPGDARRAWARRYALSLGMIDEKTAEEEVPKEAGQQYDAIARLIAESVAHAEKGLSITGDLGQRSLDEAEAIKRRVQDAEKEAARHRSKSVILRTCDPTNGAEARTRLLVALEILGASSNPAAPQPLAAVTASTDPTKMADTVSDYNRPRELKGTTGGVSGTSCRLTYVPEAVHVAYNALAEIQAAQAVDSQRGTLRGAEANKLYAPIELPASSTPHPGGPGAVQLEFGRIQSLRETLSLSRVANGPAVSYLTAWQINTRTKVKSPTLDGSSIADSYAATGRHWVLSNNRRLLPEPDGKNELSYTLPSWLEEPFTAAVSSSAAIVVDCEGRYVLLSIENISPGSPGSSAQGSRSPSLSAAPASDPTVHFSLIATSTQAVRNTAWRVAFSLDGRRLFILSDNLDGFGFECGSNDRISRKLEMHRKLEPLETGPILALDPARWRWARAVVSGPWGSAAEGNYGATTIGCQVSIGTGDGSTANIALPFHDLVSAAQFSPTGNRFVLAPGRGELHLFDLSDVSAPIGRFGKPTDRFVAVAFSPTEDQLAAAHDDGRISIWPIFPTTEAIIAQARAALGSANAGLSESQRFLFGLLDPIPAESEVALEPAELAVIASTGVSSEISGETWIHETSRQTSGHRAFVMMPFGTKRAADGTVIDFDAVYKDLFAPAIAAAGLMPHRADADRRGGSIHLDMFQDLLLAEFVVADLTIDNPNVWYEIGVRHALRAGGAVLTYALRDRLPFDIAGQRTQRYALKEGKLDPDLVEGEKAALKEAIEATLGAWRGRRASPVYQQLPSLKEPDWKTLKVGDVNEFWQGLETWQSRVEVARRKQRPGDILVLAEETPNSVLEFEGLLTAARALLQLLRPRYALSVIEQARQIAPDDVRARQIEGIALGRVGRYAEARETLRRLAEEQKDGQTLGLLARTWKDEWTQIWNAHPQRKLDPLAAARETAAILQSAASAYVEAFRAAPDDYYPGINGLTLGRLWEHVTGRKSRLPLSLIAAGVGWTVAAAIDRKDYWSLATRAELAVVENRNEDALDDYAEAAALAIANRDWFALDSSSQQLDFQAELKFRGEIVAEAALIVDRAEQQLRALGSRPGQRAEPAHVVVFSGHMIDDPKVRGPGQEKPPRFPPAKIETAAARIRAALDEVGADAADLGLCGGASGGDLLFVEACLERGMRVELRLARAENEFLAESVTFADLDHRWERSFAVVKENPLTTILVMPEELGPAPQGVSVHDRCNRWILYTALSQGLRRTSFVALWNGEPGDGPGGIQNMVELVRKLTGTQPIIIDPTTL
jgi:tetratricopeptide (TPR) repeat protein